MIKLVTAELGVDGQVYVTFENGVPYAFDPKPILQQRLIAIPQNRPVRVSVARTRSFLIIESTRIYASVLYKIATYKGV